MTSKAREFIEQVDEGMVANVVVLIASWLAYMNNIGALPPRTQASRPAYAEMASSAFKMKKDDSRISKAIDKFMRESD